MRIPIPREAAQMLANLEKTRARADSEARGIIVGLALAAGHSPGRLLEIDDGDEPALVFAEAPPPDG